MSRFLHAGAYISVRATSDGKAQVAIDYVPPCEDGTFARTFPLIITPDDGLTGTQEWLKACLVQVIEAL